jgi:hypothetical protein
MGRQGKGKERLEISMSSVLCARERQGDEKETQSRKKGNGRCNEVATEDVDVSSTSQRDNGDTEGCVLPMRIAY